MVKAVNMPNPISRNKVTKSGRRFIILANKMAKKTWKQMTNIAPKTNHSAFRFPSL
jgi:hypothetical protein